MKYILSFLLIFIACVGIAQTQYAVGLGLGGAFLRTKQDRQSLIPPAYTPMALSFSAFGRCTYNVSPKLDVSADVNVVNEGFSARIYNFIYEDQIKSKFSFWGVGVHTNSYYHLINHQKKKKRFQLSTKIGLFSTAYFSQTWKFGHDPKVNVASIYNTINYGVNVGGKYTFFQHKKRPISIEITHSMGLRGIDEQVDEEKSKTRRISLSLSWNLKKWTVPKTKKLVE